MYDFEKEKCKKIKTALRLAELGATVLRRRIAHKLATCSAAEAEELENQLFEMREGLSELRKELSFYEHEKEEKQ